MKQHPEMQYLNILESMMKNIDSNTLKLKGDRTGTGTYSEVGGQMIFDLQQGFPLLTSKKVAYKSVFIELLWFIKGDTNIKFLVDQGVNIWNEWAFQNYIDENNKTLEFPKYSDCWKNEMKKFINKIKESSSDDKFVKKWGDLGPVYGKQWRNFNGIDQLQNAIDTINNNPNSRRIIVSSWNPEEVNDMALPPCHTMYQFIVNDGKLNLHLYQRSADLFLGVPFNIASYALLIHLVAKITGLEVGNFVHSFGDRHIYSNHIEQVKQQLDNKNKLFDLPELTIKNRGQKNIEDFLYEDIILDNYNHHKFIKAPVAV